MKKNLKAFIDTINIPQILIGLSVLSLGVLLYLIDRPSNQTYFIHKYCPNLSLYNIVPNLFGIFGNSLPTLIHVFSFILITAGLINCHKKGCLFICTCWFLTDIFLEIGQKFKTVSISISPDWFLNFPFLENSRAYFVSGVFDFNDLTAITIGAVSAFFVVLISIKRRES